MTKLPGTIVDAMSLQAREARLRLMMDAVPAMITYLDTDERYLFVNKPYADLVGVACDEVVGRTLEEVLGVEVSTALRPHRERVLRGERTSYERQHRRRDGLVRDLSVTFVPHFDDVDPAKVQGFFSLTLDITDLKALERRLAYMAQHDTLTGLPNRALYVDRLAHALERYKRHQASFALLYVDVDHFKAVNDQCGHAVGDALLRAVSNRLRQCVRAADTVARLGGDEFAILLEGPIRTDHAEAVAQKVVDAMRLPFELASEGQAPQVTASIGVAMSFEGEVNARELEGRADAALYAAKARGRNTYVVR